MSIRDAPQEKVGKAHKKTTNERGRPGNSHDASTRLTSNFRNALIYCVCGFQGRQNFGQTIPKPRQYHTKRPEVPQNLTFLYMRFYKSMP